MPPKTSKQKAALQRWIRRRGVPIPVALPVAAGLPLAPLVATNDEEAVMNGSGLHSLRNGGRRIAKVLLSEKERAKLFKSKREYMQKKRNDVRDNNAAIALRKKKKRHENSQKILGGRLIERRTSQRLRLPSERKFLGDLQKRVDLKIDREKIVAKETSDRVQKRIRELTTKMERSHSKLKEQVELIERLKKRSAKIMNTFNINGGGGGGGGVSSGSVDVKGDEDDDVRSVDSDATGVVDLQEEEEDEGEPPKKKKKMAVKTEVKKTRTAASS